MLNNFISSQRTLDVSLTPRIPQFTKAGLMEYIIELIVSEDDVSFPSYIAHLFNLPLF
jgi:hypothetical protein